MAKQATLTTITSANNNATTLNANFNALNAALLNTLSIDGSTPNSMTADFDINSNGLLNGGSISASSLTLGGVLVTNVANVFNDYEGDWATATAYQAYDIVRNGASYYICLVAHTSGTFSTDLAAANWKLWFTSNYDASAVAFTGGTVAGITSRGVAGDVQITSNSPTILMTDSNVATTHQKIRMNYNAETFLWSVYDSTDVLLAHELAANVDATGVTQWSFRIGGTQKLVLDSSALNVIDNLRVGDNTNPTVAFEVGDTGAMLVPAGTTGQRPGTGVNGYLRYNSTDSQFEGYAGGAWGALGGGGGGTAPTRTTASWSSAATQTITIPSGCTRAVVSGTAEMATASANLQVQIRNTSSTADTWSGASNSTGTASVTSGAANWMFCGGNVDQTREFYLEIISPRDAAKATLCKGNMASDDEFVTRDGRMDTTEDHDEIHFKTSSGNITGGTVEVEFFYG